MPELAPSLEDLADRNLALQASHMGEAIYRRLGYREYGRTARWSR